MVYSLKLPSSVEEGSLIWELAYADFVISRSENQSSWHGAPDR
jgi:hypothetical protein